MIQSDPICICAQPEFDRLSKAVQRAFLARLCQSDKLRAIFVVGYDLNIPVYKLDAIYDEFVTVILQKKLNFSGISITPPVKSTTTYRRKQGENYGLEIGQPLTCPSIGLRERINYIWAYGPIAKRLTNCRVLYEGAFRTYLEDPRSFALSDHVPVLAIFN